LKVFLETLVNDSVLYKNIFDPDSKKWEKNQMDIKRNLIHLNNFRVTQQIPMVLAVLRELYSERLRPKLAIDCLDTIEKFHYLFSAVTSQRSSGGIALMYSSFARKLTNAANDQDRNKIIKELKQKMREKLPTIDEFLAGFKKLKFTNEFTRHKKLIHYTLSKIDAHYSSHGLVVDYEHMTIEHIYAQNPKRKPTASDIPIGQIGNLILVSEKLNIDLANKDFLTKKKIISNAKIFIDEIIFKAEKWEGEEIEQRTDYLGRLAYEAVFKI
jgi:hypothetical protein